jgi:hypothetical protein
MAIFLTIEVGNVTHSSKKAGFQVTAQWICHALAMPLVTLLWGEEVMVASRIVAP